MAQPTYEELNRLLAVLAAAVDRIEALERRVLALEGDGRALTSGFRRK